ncbi:MAG: ferritin family protein [Candidatus Krumholzibacteriales bacterium]
MKGKNMERDYTTLEIFSIAIKSEIEAEKLYQHMKGMTENTILQEKFDFLISQEKKHEQILKEAYEKMFPEVELKTPENSPVPLLDDILSDNPSLKKLFEVAMEAEKRAQSFYSDLARKTRNQSSSSLLNYMARMERSHLALLEVEYEQLETGAEIESDDFLRGDRLMNLGP